MNLSLVFRFLFFFLNLSPEHFQKLRLQKHLFYRDKNLKYHLDYFTHGKFKAYTVRDYDFIINTFVAVEFNKIIEFIVDDFEFFTNEFFKEKYVSVFIDIEKSIDVGPDGSAYLPSVSAFETVEAICVRVNIL